MGNGAVRRPKINTDCACGHFLQFSGSDAVKQRVRLKLSYAVAAEQEICCDCDQQNAVADKYQGSA
jgi:hypothetical protein